MGVHVKCSGLTRAEDIEIAVESGVDYIGLVLTAGDAALDAASALALGARGVGFEGGLVGVFAGATRPFIETACVACDLDVIELGGGTAPGALADAAALRPLWVRIAVAPGANGDALAAEAARAGDAEVLVVDGGRGTGGEALYRSRAAAALVAERRVLLAGGFDATTVGPLVASLDPFGVEISSDVISGDGRLDAARLVTFLDAVRAAERTA